MSDAIVLSDVVVRRGGREVLCGVSFSVPASSVTGLLGPSGSGKTTAMRAIVGVAMLRERTSCTLERLLTMPVSRLDLLLGYGIAFAVVATVQALITSAVAFGLLGLDIEGSVAAVVGFAVLNALLGMSLGLFASAFAQTEFQAVQFMPAFVLPQFLLCGLLVPRDQMAPLLEWISYALPLTWAVDGIQRAVNGGDPGRVLLDAAIVVGVTVLALGLGAATLRRRTP